MKRFFITGTDTDCGKTYATCALLDYLGEKAVAIKPIASGCLKTEDGLVSEDALQLQKHCNLDLSQINLWRFAMPVSPHIASDYENISLSIEEIADYCMNFTVGAEYLLIEGAGGLMVPLTANKFWVDMLKVTQIPVILVVGIKTGCINHALLTQVALQAHGLEFTGWIANGVQRDVLAWEENIATLKQHLTAPLLGVIEHGGIFRAENSCELSDFNAE